MQVAKSSQAENLLQEQKMISDIYSSVLKCRNLAAQNGKVQNQASCKLSQIQKFASYKSFLEFYLVYKNVCLKFLRQKLQKLEIVNFDKISSHFYCLLIFTKLNE